MIIKLFLLFFISCSLLSDLYSQKLEGVYLIGDTKAEIKIERQSYRIYWENKDRPLRLKYNQNTVLNEQIWNEIFRGEIVGSFRFQQDYLAGVYVRQIDNKEFKIQKIE